MTSKLPSWPCHEELAPDFSAHLPKNASLGARMQWLRQDIYGGWMHCLSQERERFWVFRVDDIPALSNSPHLLAAS